MILDVGCAQGRDLRFFISQEFQPVGIDLSLKLLHAGRQGQLVTLLMDMRFMGFRSEVFDGFGFVHLSCIFPNLRRMESFVSFAES